MPVARVTASSQALAQADRLAAPTGVVIGLANDYIGYIVNEKEFAHGGYEVESRSYYGHGLGTFVAQRAGDIARSLK